MPPGDWDLPGAGDGEVTVVAPPRDETALVSRARSGDDSAFAELVELHRPAWWLICLRLTGNPHDAADALQDALTAVWLHIGTFRGEARFGTWTHRIAVNAALAVVRGRREIPSEQVRTDHGLRARDFAEAVVVRDEITRALEGLPVAFRETLVLREYGGLSYAEIAHHQGIALQTVRSRLHRARSAVAVILREPGP